MPDIQFSSLADFIDMGGYAVYVWSSYAFFAVVLAYNLIQPRLARKRFFKQQVSRQQRDKARSNEQKGET